jgi:hypothetical protein
MLATLLIAGVVLTACDANPVALHGDDDVQSIQVLSHAESVPVGQTLQLEAVATNPAGRPVNASVTWESLHPKAASVDNDGLVTGLAVGEAGIVARVRGDADTTFVAVVEGDEHDHGSHDPPSDDASSGEWDNVLENVSFDEDVVVPDGETWLIGANVKIAGNLRTHGGTIAMRPGSSLHFIGADPDRYVGGGMGYEDRFSNDIGLWVGHHGVLDIRGTPKTGWNRTGVDSTWDPDDEYWISPTDRGDYSPRRWYPGDPIPQVDPRVPAAEVMNVTRDIVIEGPGHIHIHSSKPQWIEYVTLRNLGVSNRSFEGPVLGRYALHLHHGENGTRGTVIRGVAAIDSRGTVYVPHESHGVTMEDIVSVNSYGPAFWWDKGDLTHDLVVDGLAASGVHMPEEVAGTVRNFPVAKLGSGLNKTMRNSAVSGSRGSDRALGYHWNTESAHRWETSAVWDFHDNVAHNNEGFAIRFWFNDKWDHNVRSTHLYHNDAGGIENGAYKNSIRYTNVVLVDDHILHHSSSNVHDKDGGPSRYAGVEVYTTNGPALEIGRLRGSPETRQEFIDCKLESGPGAPKVFIEGEKALNPFIALFRNCGVTPDDIEFGGWSSELEGTNIILEEGGRKWEITVDLDSNRKIVREL